MTFKRSMSYWTQIDWENPSVSNRERLKKNKLFREEYTSLVKITSIILSSEEISKGLVTPTRIVNIVRKELEYIEQQKEQIKDDYILNLGFLLDNQIQQEDQDVDRVPKYSPNDDGINGE